MNDLDRFFILLLLIYLTVLSDQWTATLFGEREKNYSIKIYITRHMSNIRNSIERKYEEITNNIILCIFLF